MPDQGKLFVLEGIDASGKGTHSHLLRERFVREGLSVHGISFPRYGNAAAYFEERYLRDQSRPYGEPVSVNPYAASVFYSLDRFDASFEMWDVLKNGTHIVADRYVVSNLAHQGGKIADENDRIRYVEWLYDFEYGKCNIPKPALNIILHVPTKVALRRSEERAAREGDRRKKDAHELDERHIHAAQEAYLWAPRRYPDQFAVVECIEDGRELTQAEVHEKIWNIIRPKL